MCPNGDPLTTDDGKDRGSLLHYYSGAPIDAFMGWDSSNSEFALGSNVSVTNEVVTFNTLGNLRIQSLAANIGNFSGNVTAANANLGNVASANFFIGSGNNLSNIQGSNVTGQVGNAAIAGSVYTNSQPNITSVGTLTSLSISGTVTSGNAVLGNTANANYFYGNGYYLTDLNPGNIGTVANANFAAYAGNITTASQPNITSVGTLTSLSSTGNSNVANVNTGNISASGNVTVANANLGNAATANFFIGSGNNLSNIQAANITGTVANANYAAYAGDVVNATQSNITSIGILTSLSISGALNGNVVSIIGNLTVANANLGNAASANFFIGSGNNLSNIQGANVSGTVANATHAATANTVVDATQSNITGLGTLTALTVGPNSSVILSGTSGYVKANSLQGNDGSQTIYLYYGNISGAAGVATDLTVGAGGTGNLLVSGTGNVTGNLRAANANLGNVASANYFQGDGGLLTNISVAAGSYIVNGTSNVHLDNNGNLHVDIAGNTDKLVVTGTGANVNGYLTVSGNLEAGNANLGNAATANYFIGSGNNLSNIQVGNVSGLGNIATVNLDGNSGNILYGNGVFAAAASPYGNSNVASFLASYGSNTITTTGNVTVGNIIGNGQALTGLAGANVTGTVANANYAAYAGNVTIAGQSNITSLGTLTGLSATGNANIADLNVSGNAVITGNLTVSGTTEYINVTNLAVKDPIISIGRGDNNAPLTTDDGKDRGEQLWYYSGSEKSAFIGYDNSAGKIIAAKDVSISSEVVTVNTYGNFVVGDLEANTVSATGNIVGNNVNAGNIISAGGNVIGANINTSGVVSATGNVTSNNVNAGNIISAGGNITGANINTSGVVSAAGNVTGNFILGNGAYLTGVSTSSDIIFSGNSNVFVNANSNIDFTIAGNADVVVFTGTGANINGYANITGNANIGNVNTGIVSATGNVIANNVNAGNIISAGGNITGANLNTAGVVSATGNIETANYVLGNGYYLTGLSVGIQDKIASGNSNVYIPTANGNVTITTAGNANVVVVTGTGVNIAGYANITGNINANVFTGNGSSLSNLAGANVTGQVGNALVAGTVYTASQPNITSVGTLTSLTVGPNSSIILSGNTGYVRANSIQGRDGSQAIYPYYQNVSGAVGIVTDLTIGASGGGNLTVANGNVAFSGANVGLGNVSNLHIDGGTFNYFLKTDGAGNLSWALPAAAPGGGVNELQFNNTGAFGGAANLTFDSNEYRLSIQNYSLVVQTLGGVSGATTINVTDGCYVTATSAGITTWIFTFPAPTSNACGFVLELVNGGTYTQNWPLSVKWPGGTAPELTASGTDVLIFITRDNGSTWRAAVSMLDSV